MCDGGEWGHRLPPFTWKNETCQCWICNIYLKMDYVGMVSARVHVVCCPQTIRHVWFRMEDISITSTCTRTATHDDGTCIAWMTCTWFTLIVLNRSRFSRSAVHIRIDESSISSSVYGGRYRHMVEQMRFYTICQLKWLQVVRKWPQANHPTTSMICVFVCVWP